MKHYVLISACPAGVASSFLAVETMAAAAKEKGITLKTEVDSFLSTERLDASTIESAEAVIVAAHEISESVRERLAGKPVLFVSVQEALSQPAQVLDNVDQAHPLQEQTHSLQEIEETKASSTIIAVTACPTGVAHTFMSADALANTAKDMGLLIHVEKQGSAGIKDPLSAEQVQQADVVILATDIEVDSSRFVGKRVYKTSTREALRNAGKVIESALDNTEVYAKKEQTDSVKKEVKQSAGAYQHLLTGVSYMLPLVVAGGLLIALSFAFGINAFEQEGTFAAALMQIGGGSAFALMVPVLAGYIAFSIAERPGLAPGMIGGMLASTMGAGFLGGIVAGFIAGYSANGVKKVIRLPATMESLMPVLVIPLISSLITGLLMVYAIGEPVKAIMDTMTSFLQGMGGTNAILLGALLGAMMAFDMGGPINKAAYTFGVGLITSQTYGPMAAVMAAGMVPPLGMAIATFMARQKFSKEERESGKAAGILGLCFISEGAIPFAARDPLKVIPSCVVGAAITGAMSMWMGIGLKAPHGGVFVMLIPEAINNVGGYALAIALGSIVTGALYAGLKRTVK